MRKEAARVAATGCTAAASSAATGCTLTGLTNGTAYTVTAAAINILDTGPPSESATATPATVPGVVGNLTQRYVFEDLRAFELRWAAPATDGGASINGYRVMISDADGNNIRILLGCEGVFSDSNAVSCTSSPLVNPLFAGHRLLRVAARNAVGVGPAATVPVFVAQTPEASIGADRVITLRWIPAPGITYVLNLNPYGGGTQNIDGALGHL